MSTVEQTTTNDLWSFPNNLKHAFSGATLITAMFGLIISDWFTVWITVRNTYKNNFFYFNTVYLKHKINNYFIIKLINYNTVSLYQFQKTF